MDMTSCSAGVTQVPQEHCAPAQFQAPSFAPQRGVGQTIFPSKPPIATWSSIHGRGSLRKSDEQGFEELGAIEPKWQSIVLPAVTWLYSWVEWHMQSAGQELPLVIQQAHRAAIACASEHAAKISDAQPDGLAVSVRWPSPQASRSPS